MYIAHITLNTGHVTRIERGDVTGETLARIGPWLAALVASGVQQPLPLSPLNDYTAAAAVAEGALMLSVFGRPIVKGVFAGQRPPLVTLGVAKRSRHGAALWPVLMRTPGIRPGLRQPAEPWCAVGLWPTAGRDMQAMHWLGDMERCVAWAWCSRPEDGP